MSPQSQPQRLETLLVDQIDLATAQNLVSQLADIQCESALLELIDELGEISSKIQGEAISALGEIGRRGCLGSVVPWLDLGITLAQATGALGLRYFKESPAILGFLGEPAQRAELLAQVLELADGPTESAPQCAYEWFKVLPQLAQDHSQENMQQWASLGMELAGWNYVLGNEFFRESPAIARAIPLEGAKDWIGFGMKLMVQNSFGKPDYVGTLEFFRTSPSLFMEIVEPEVKRRVIDLGSNLADRSPEKAITFLAEAPTILSRLPSQEWKVRVLKFGLLIVDQDPETALIYFRRVPEVLEMQGPSEDTTVFDAWFTQGMEALEYSLEAGRAFFALETRQACAVVEEALSGVSLRQVSRSLKMFAMALCGREVSLEPLPESGAVSDLAKATTHSARAQLSRKNLTIYLPLMMKRSPTQEGNRRWYSVMVAHEVGHVEFGTYRVSHDVLQRVALNAKARYEKTGKTQEQAIRTLGDLFRVYPQSRIIRDLWEIIEDARIDFFLKQEYPGLQEDLAILTKEAIQTRTLSHGMTAREIVLDALLLYFSGLTNDDFSRPGLQEVIDEVWAIARTILRPTATVNDGIELADRLYQELEARIGTFVSDPDEDQREALSEETSVSEAGHQHEATEHLNDDYQPVLNWEFRGVLNPDHIEAEDQQTSEPESRGQHSGGGLSEGMAGRSSDRQQHSPSQASPDPQKPLFGASPLQQWFQPNLQAQDGRHGTSLGSGRFVYDEWDGRIRDYRPQWCQVFEQAGVEGSSDFVDETFHAYGPMVRLIRRYFETIRPEAFRRLGRQSNGEDIDLDALVNWMVDRRHGLEPSDQVYSTRQKHDRHVAVAFLVDMSGSTGRQIGSRARPVIDIEKEGLLLLSEALSAIGDQYAIYGFSGQGRQAVDIHVLKDFEQRSGGRVGLKISGVKSRQQNRDGAAIRHATHRLMQQAAKVRLLILISDGKPLDDDYADEYSLEDTKMALREARQKGIHPFCITIDQAATDYVKRMYGDIGFLVVDEVESLPTRLPKIYQRLTAR
ncbi:MAG: VWA domain-containing protein [Nitrospirales bacterium]